MAKRASKEKDKPKGIGQLVESKGIKHIIEPMLQRHSEWLVSNGFPDDLHRAVKIAVAELREFAISQDVGEMSTDNIWELLQTCVDRRQWRLSTDCMTVRQFDWEFLRAKTASSDQTPVTAKRLADFVPCHARTVSEALKTLRPSVEGRGRNGGHQWRYSEAVAVLKDIQTGKLAGVNWPDSENRLIPQKDSSKIPARKSRR